MLSRLLEIIFPSEPVTIGVACQRPIAVRRLKQYRTSALSPKWWFAPSHPGGVAGRVDQGGVHLHRVYPKTGLWTWANSWKPWLKASFEYAEGQLQLQGRFRMHPFVQVFSAFWLGLAAFIALYSFFLFFVGPFEGHQGEVPFLFPLGAAAFGFGGWGLMQAAWHWSEDDMAYIQRFIEEHVGRNAGAGG